MNKSNRALVVVLMAFLWLSGFSVKAQEDQTELAETTKYCFTCHGNEYYSFDNSETGAREKKRMNPYFRIDSLAFKHGEHGSFSCDDCHSPDYQSYPHNGDLKLEFKYSCMDCHGGDPTYAHLHFDEIERDAMKSVHAQRLGDAFKCEMCHSPHTNRLVASSQKYGIKDIVAFDNGMCLNCHADASLYHVFAEKEKPELSEIHSWLPNQALHFKNVRCIECHTARNDTMMVAHNILPKEQAVSRCTECHSTNSLLQDKLYKYMSTEARSENGIGSAFQNKSYVIGKNRYEILNKLSLIIFALVLSGVALHTVIRIIKRK
ncbi:MAG: hypothetical protein ACERKD_04570 [Prolixibacteraceae bacterium]